MVSSYVHQLLGRFNPHSLIQKSTKTKLYSFNRIKVPYHGYMTVFPRGGFFKEILREYYGKFSGQTKTGRCKNCGKQHTETTLKSRLFSWLSLYFLLGLPRTNKGNLVEMLWPKREKIIPISQLTKHKTDNKTEILLT